METNQFKTKVLICLVIGWIIFSVGYIIWDLWGDFKNNEMRRAYQQGQAAAVNSLITQTENCKIVPVFNGQKQIQLIRADCLNKSKEK